MSNLQITLSCTFKEADIHLLDTIELTTPTRTLTPTRAQPRSTTHGRAAPQQREGAGALELVCPGTADGNEKNPDPDGEGRRGRGSSGQAVGGLGCHPAGVHTCPGCSRAVRRRCRAYET